jgi:hypothetical protein
MNKPSASPPPSDANAAPAPPTTAALSQRSSWLLQQIQQTVAEKTSFKASEVQLVQDKLVEQDFKLSATFILYKNIKVTPVNGYFKAQSKDIRAPDDELAQSGMVALIEKLQTDAEKRLDDKVKNHPGLPLDLEEGIYLGTATRFWSLHKCQTCNKEGEIVCDMCAGNREYVCPQCKGNQKLPCRAPGCDQGRTMCMTCLGSGEVVQEKDVPYEFSGGGKEGGPQTVKYQTVKEMIPCPNAECVKGTVPCLACRGNAVVPCPRCNGKGACPCEKCKKTGKLSCPQCAGSHETGQMYEGSIDLKIHHHTSLPAQSSEYGKKIFELEQDPIQIANLSSSVVQQEYVGWSGLDNHRMLKIVYGGRIDIESIEVACNSKKYKAVAYGKNRQWLTQGGIVESLQESDFEELRQVGKKIDAQQLSMIDYKTPQRVLQRFVVTADNRDALQKPSTEAYTSAHGNECRTLVLKCAQQMKFNYARLYLISVCAVVFFAMMGLWLVIGSTGFWEFLIIGVAGYCLSLVLIVKMDGDIDQLYARSMPSVKNFNVHDAAGKPLLRPGGWEVQSSQGTRMVPSRLLWVFYWGLMACLFYWFWIRPLLAWLFGGG